MRTDDDFFAGHLLGHVGIVNGHRVHAVLATPFVVFEQRVERTVHRAERAQKTPDRMIVVVLTGIGVENQLENNGKLIQRCKGYFSNRRRRSTGKQWEN